MRMSFLGSTAAGKRTGVRSEAACTGCSGSRPNASRDSSASAARRSDVIGSPRAVLVSDARSRVGQGRGLPGLARQGA